jgi:hypothetical protein
MARRIGKTICGFPPVFSSESAVDISIVHDMRKRQGVMNDKHRVIFATRAATLVLIGWVVTLLLIGWAIFHTFMESLQMMKTP